jgi:hypothetical protein
MLTATIALITNVDISVLTADWSTTKLIGGLTDERAYT